MNYELYQKALDRAIDKSGLMPKKSIRIRESLKELVYYGIKSVNSGRNDIKLVNVILKSIKFIRPRELLEMFPLDKYQDPLIYYAPLDEYNFYDKDYQSSLNYINSFGLYNTINDPITFLMEYMNNDIRAFVVNASIVMDSQVRCKRPEYLKIIRDEEVR